jgi:peptide/nickel transport system ATP-binding protein
LSGRPRRPVEGEAPNAIEPPPGCAFHPRCRYADARCRAELPQLIGYGFNHGRLSRGGGGKDLAV